MLGLQGTDRVLYVFAILMTPQTRVPCPTPRANKRWLKDTVLSARVVYVARPVENSMKVGQREEVINLEGKPWEDTTVQCFFTSKWEEELATSVQRSSILTLFFVCSFVPRRILNRHTQRGSFKIWVVPFKFDPPGLLLPFCDQVHTKGGVRCCQPFPSRAVSQRSQEEKLKKTEIKGSRLSRESEGTETSSVYYLPFPFQCCLGIWVIRKKGF